MQKFLDAFSLPLPFQLQSSYLILNAGILFQSSEGFAEPFVAHITHRLFLSAGSERCDLLESNCKAQMRKLALASATVTCLCPSLGRQSCLFSFSTSVTLVDFPFEREKGSGAGTNGFGGVVCVDANEVRSQLKCPARALP